MFANDLIRKVSCCAFVYVCLCMCECIHICVLRGMMPAEAWGDQMTLSAPLYAILRADFLLELGAYIFSASL